MALNYAEFDTTQANLLTDLRTQILASSDWSQPNAAGKPSLYKATTTRGANMIFDLEQAAIALDHLTIGVWRTHDGTTGTDFSQRYLYFRNGNGTTTMPLHCIVSAGKEHVFISVEGPRATEANANNANYGSPRHYFFMCDVVPYFANDPVPVVAAGGQMVASVASSIGNNNHLVGVSRNFANTSSWTMDKLLSLGFPTLSTADTINVQHTTTADGNFQLFPYVVVGDNSGMRGRLATFFFAGLNGADNPEVATAPVGAKVSYQGQNYKLLAVNKGDGSGSFIWNQFGAAANNYGNYWRSPVVAVPCL